MKSKTKPWLAGAVVSVVLLGVLGYVLISSRYGTQ